MFLVKRAAAAILLLWAVVTVVFFALRLVPGGPAVAVLGDWASSDKIEAFNKKWGLDKPVFIQYYVFIKQLLAGNLGRAYTTGAKITPMIIRALPYSITLALAGTIVSFLIGLPAGVLSAVMSNTWVDKLSRVLALMGISIPDFYLGILLIMIFSLSAHWLPMLGAGEWNAPFDMLRRLIMPALTLGMASGATIMRICRSSMLDTLNADYIRTARSKGLSERAVIFKHALRNALIPVLTIAGINMGLMLGNVVLIETIFSRPGLGKLLIGSIMDRDFSVTQSTIIVFAALIVMINFLTDLSYCLVNPRVRYD